MNPYLCPMKKFGLTALVAVSVNIQIEMEEFHRREVRHELTGAGYPEPQTYPRLVFHVWHPEFTMGIPTALCLN